MGRIREGIQLVVSPAARRERRIARRQAEIEEDERLSAKYREEARGRTAKQNRAVALDGGNPSGAGIAALVHLPDDEPSRRAAVRARADMSDANYRNAVWKTWKAVGMLLFIVLCTAVMMEVVIRVVL